MLRKALGIAVVACVAAMGVVSSASTAGAVETSRPVPMAAVDSGVLASPKCSGTASHGKIRYQVCVQYNCDSTSCYHRGYLGLINTATSPRTVTWDLDWSTVNLSSWYPDDNVQVTLAAGEQRTILSRSYFNTRPCGFTAERRLRVGYDSSGMSPFVYVSDFLACV